MPQLVKGGKYVFGWSKVGSNGKIVIPNEAREEYKLMGHKNAILMPGSKTSGGFSLTTLELVKDAHLAVIINKVRSLVSEGDMAEINGKCYCGVKIKEDGSFFIALEILKQYKIEPGDYLLAVRGSGLALGFIVQGSIIEEAKKHSEIEEF
ncbi:MAG: hypothetical protein ACFFC7_16015 [Candidatus Hermodarchaeota archaeon]